MRFALATVVFFSLGCRPEPVAARAPSETPRDAVLHNATLSTWRKDAPVISARAKTVTWYRGDSRFAASEVTAELPSREGAVQVTAPVVEGNVAGDAVDAKGGVTVRSARGVATGPSAHCENSPQGTVVSSQEGLVATSPGQRLTAKAFRIDVAEQRATFEGAETSHEAAQ